jgi:hypothetical protein
MILAPAIGALAVHGISAGFRPYEKTLVAALWLVPVLARSVAYATFLPVGVFLLLAALIFLAVFAFRDKGILAYKTQFNHDDVVHHTAGLLRL